MKRRWLRPEVKKGDIIQRNIITKDGKALVHNLSSKAKGEEWIKRTGASARVDYDELNPGFFAVLALGEHVDQVQAEVMWVVDKEVSLKFKGGVYKIINLDEEPEWRVIREAVPTYQSAVARLTDEALKKSIDALRRTRVAPVRPLRRARREPAVSDDPMAKALSKMSPEKKAALMKKLGMTD